MTRHRLFGLALTMPFYCGCLQTDFPAACDLDGPLCFADSSSSDDSSSSNDSTASTDSSGDGSIGDSSVDSENETSLGDAAPEAYGAGDSLAETGPDSGVNHGWTSIGTLPSKATGAYVDPAYQQLSVGPGGNITAVWLQTKVSALEGYAAAAQWTGSAWVDISPTTSGTSVYPPFLSKLSDGTPVITWKDSGAPLELRKWNGLSWDLIGPTGTARPLFTPHALTVDGSGNPLLMYTTGSGASKVIKVTRVTGDTLSNLVDLTMTGATAVSNLVVDSNFIYLATRQTDGANQMVHLWRWSPAGWLQIGPPLTAITGTDPDGAITLNVTSSHELTVGLHQTDGSTQKYFLFQIVDTTSPGWGPAGVIAAPSGQILNFAATVIDPKDRIVTVWQSADASDSNKSTVHATRCFAGTCADLEDIVSAKAVYSSVTADSSGRLYAGISRAVDELLTEYTLEVFQHSP